MQVGKVAAPAAGDQNLFADTLSALQHCHAASALAGFNGTHQAGSARAENDYIELKLHERLKISDATRPRRALPGRSS